MINCFVSSYEISKAMVKEPLINSQNLGYCAGAHFFDAEIFYFDAFFMRFLLKPPVLPAFSAFRAD